MDAYKDAILAHAVYYPVVEVLSAIAIAGVIWFGGGQVHSHMVTLGVWLRSSNMRSVSSVPFRT